ncbi:MAG TPA: flagellar hook capping FlgD N-terminal domain-containing protein [Kofleriaceae bacterium]|nr:flagellar hook capping FlgD N-terminal domain-containing protein [Kofleriaceae bacterium]
MTVSATSSTAAATGATATGTTGSNALTGSKDEFLKLFMAQLQNQDPLNPQNGADMVAQLAQFSSVEQQTQTNQQLADLASAQAAQSSASLSNLVGRTCNAAVGDVTIDRKGAPPPIQIASDTPTVGASITITDASGKAVRKIAIPDGTTATTLAWDGNTDAGTAAPAGDYKVSIDAGKNTATVSAQWQGRVDGIELTAAGARLRMGDVLIAPADVRMIGLDSTSTASPTP